MQVLAQVWVKKRPLQVSLNYRGKLHISRLAILIVQYNSALKPCPPYQIILYQIIPRIKDWMSSLEDCVKTFLFEDFFKMNINQQFWVKITHFPAQNYLCFTFLFFFFCFKTINLLGMLMATLEPLLSRMFRVRVLKEK